jgi:hypothetical protein
MHMTAKAMKRKTNKKRNTITMSISYHKDLGPLIEERCRTQNRSKSNYISALILDDLDREAIEAGKKKK